MKSDEAVIITVTIIIIIIVISNIIISIARIRSLVCLKQFPRKFANTPQPSHDLFKQRGLEDWQALRHEAAVLLAQVEAAEYEGEAALSPQQHTVVCKHPATSTAVASSLSGRRHSMASGAS